MSASAWNYIYYWSAHTEVSPEHFYGPIHNHQLLARNGSMWALSRHKENMHVGSTNQFGKVCIMGLIIIMVTIVL